MKYFLKGEDLERIGELVPEDMVSNKLLFHDKFLKGGKSNFENRVFVRPAIFTDNESKVSLGYKINGSSLEIQRKGYLPIHFSEKLKLDSGTWYLHNNGEQITASTSSSDPAGGFFIGYSSDIKSLAFIIQGAGGGGAARNLFHAGGGGGAGGTLICADKVPQGVWTLVIGSPGVSGRGDNQCGSAGGSSGVRINGNIYNAYGGAGGGTGKEAALGNGGSGGGTTSNGAKRITGASGGNKGSDGGGSSRISFKFSEDFTYYYPKSARSGGAAHSGGGGGSSAFGNGGEGGGSPTIHGSTGGIGAGGGGGQKAKSSYGGNGGCGMIIIYY